MLRSRMFTPAFRFYAAMAAAGLVGAFISGVSSGGGQGFIDRVVGPITVGWKGGVGNHVSYAVLLSWGVVSAILAGLHIAFRDADPEAEAQVVHTESVPLTRAPTGTNFLPLVAAFAVAVLMIGQVTDQVVTLAGFGLLVAVVGVWMLRAWAERATGDPEYNRQLYARFIEPLRIPVLSAVIVGFLAIGLSRVLLAVSHTGAVVVFGVVASLFLFGAALIAARPAVSRNAITLILFIGAIAVVGAGIAAAVVGERDFEHHHEEELHGGGGAEGTTEGGLAPITVTPVSPEAEPS
jgi:MFS family permease